VPSTGNEGCFKNISTVVFQMAFGVRLLCGTFPHHPPLRMLVRCLSVRARVEATGACSLGSWRRWRCSRWFCGCGCVGRGTEHLERWIICTPLSINVFVIRIREDILYIPSTASLIHMSISAMSRLRVLSHGCVSLVNLYFLCSDERSTRSHQARSLLNHALAKESWRHCLLSKLSLWQP
jgi:hypothetical protein